MKDKIRKILHETFISEANTPGISVTDKVKKDAKKINKEAQKDIASKLGKYVDYGNKDSDFKPVKRELSDEEQDISNHLEKRGGMADIEYDGGVDEKFKERQEMAIKGDPKMGNTDDTVDSDFGEEYIERIKKTKELKDKARKTIVQMGDDIELAKGKSKGDKKKIAVENQIKTIRFKNKFNGLDKTLNLIPEDFKFDNNEFVMTDGNETYKIRWEGTKVLGEAVVLQASNKEKVNEDINKIFKLFDYNPKEKLVKNRLNEDKEFNDLWNKSIELYNGK